MKRVAVVFLGLTLTACVRTHTTDLAVPPPEVRLQVAGAQNVGVKVSVSDKRRDKSNVGAVWSSTGDGGNSFVVVPRQPVDQVVASGIDAELKARGFRVAEGQAYLLVDVRTTDSMTKWYLFRSDVEGSVELAVQVLNSSGNPVYSQSYRQNGKSSIKVFVNQEDEGKAKLEEVLGTVIRSMLEDDAVIQALAQANRGS